MEIKIIKAGKKELRDIGYQISSRSKMDEADVHRTVSGILDDIRIRGDKALIEYTLAFDRVSIPPDMIRVTEVEIEEALNNTPDNLLAILKSAAKNIYEFHLAQKQQDITEKRGNDSYVKLISRPIETAGIYVPGGTAPLPSSVLMNALPAKAAGVSRIIMCTPPSADKKVNSLILAAASVAGVDEIYRAGGAQAIAAMAFGTNTIPKADKICGPGNIYVNVAKKMVFGHVDIDMFAGPSEILVIADKTANPEFIASDMIAQAEHDRLASAILVTDDADLAWKTAENIRKIAPGMERADILAKSLEEYCCIVVVEDILQAVEFSNEFAPEHLEICTKNPEELLGKIKNAGAVFIGNYTPESLGDYFCGANHVLPTSGTSRFFSPLGTADFIKKMSVINYSENDFRNCYRDVAAFAEAEQLEGHARAARIRFEKDRD